MTGPRHVSEILPGVLDEICDQNTTGSLEIPDFDRMTKHDFLRIELPFPPSVNSYWRHVMIGKHPRTLISERGRNFRKAVQDEILVQNPGLLSGPISCVLDLFPPCNRRRDCDNFAKAVLDALTHAAVYHDDSQIIDLRIRMHPKRAPGSVTVTLEQIHAEHCAHNQIDLMEAV